MINQLNYNFIKLVSNYKELGIKETYIKKGDFIKKRFLKPRIDKTNTKKFFNYKLLMSYVYENILIKNIEFLSSKDSLIENRYVYYKSFKVRKKKLNSIDYFWYKSYNLFKDVHNMLWKKKKKKKRKFGKFSTLRVKKYKFNVCKLQENFFLPIIKARFHKTHKIGLVFKNKKKKYLLLKRNIKILNTFRNKPGVLWALIDEIRKIAHVLEGIRLIDYGTNQVTQYLIHMVYLRILLKGTYLVFKRAAKVYLHFALHMIRFFFLRIFNLLNKVKKGLFLIVNVYPEIDKKLITIGDSLEDMYNYYKDNYSNIFLIFLNFIYRSAVFNRDISEEVIIKKELAISTIFSRYRVKRKKRPKWFLDYLQYLFVYKTMIYNCYFSIKRYRRKYKKKQKIKFFKVYQSFKFKNKKLVV